MVTPWQNRAVNAVLVVSVIVALVVVYSAFVQRGQADVLDTISDNKAQSDCRAAVNREYNVAFGISALVELNGGEYPADALAQLNDEGIDVTVLPPVEEVEADYLAATIDVLLVYDEKDNPDGTLCRPAEESP